MSFWCFDSCYCSSYNLNYLQICFFLFCIAYYMPFAQLPMNAIDRMSCVSFKLRILLPSHLVRLLPHLVLCFLTQLLCLASFVLGIRLFPLKFLFVLSFCNIYWACYSENMFKTILKVSCAFSCVVFISVLELGC